MILCNNTIMNNNTSHKNIELTRGKLIELFDIHGTNVQVVADILGCSRQNINQRMKKLGISLEKKIVLAKVNDK